MDVAEAAFLVVDEVLAGTITMDAAGHNHFRIFRIQGTVAVVDDDRDFGKALPYR